MALMTSKELVQMAKKSWVKATGKPVFELITHLRANGFAEQRATPAGVGRR